MKKKILHLTITTILLFSLIGCGNNDSKEISSKKSIKPEIVITKSDAESTEKFTANIEDSDTETKIESVTEESYAEETKDNLFDSTDCSDVVFASLQDTYYQLKASYKIVYEAYMVDRSIKPNTEIDDMIGSAHHYMENTNMTIQGYVTDDEAKKLIIGMNEVIDFFEKLIEEYGLE